MLMRVSCGRRQRLNVIAAITLILVPIYVLYKNEPCGVEKLAELDRKSFTSKQLPSVDANLLGRPDVMYKKGSPRPAKEKSKALTSASSSSSSSLSSSSSSSSISVNISDLCIVDGQHICKNITTEKAKNLEVNEHSEEQNTHKNTELRFQKRLGLLQEKCADPDHFNSTMRYRTRKIYPTKFANGRLGFCPIAKVGSSFLKSLTAQYFPAGEDDKLRYKMKKKFVFVREPYSRLVSGYIDRIMTWQPWWGTYGRPIVAIARPNASSHERRCGSDVTFPEFVKFLIYSQETGEFLDGHFRPLHQICDFCLLKYDFIGHLETISEDMSFILESVSINNTNMTFTDSESTLIGKSNKTIIQRKETIKCKDMCSQLKTLWWSFQARGLVSEDIELPVTGSQCNTISGEELASLALKAHKDSRAKSNTRKQKKAALVNLFLQVPLRDRLRLMELYLADFVLFGYDPIPQELFPELKSR